MKHLRGMAMALFVSMATGMMGQITPTSLTVEHLSDNILIDPPTAGSKPPRFSWVNKAAAGAMGETQRAYRICVATTESAARKGKGDMWDSGKTKSDESYLIEYKGKPMSEGKDYYWSVRVWNGKGKASAWSAPQKFSTGINPASWGAKWIGAPWIGEEPQNALGKGILRDADDAPYLRKGFETRSGQIRSAKAYVTGLGYFDLFVNGKKAGNDLLVPNFTNYTSRPNLKAFGISLDEKSSGFRVSYLKYDITDMLKSGKNAVGAMLAPGYFDARKVIVGAFGSPRFICRIEIEYADGTKQSIVSDESWKAHRSGITKSDLHEGENYDARLEIPDWCSPDFDDSSWEKVVERKAPDGKLTAFDTNPDRVTKVYKPVSRTTNADGTVTVNFGKMISGRLHIKGVKAKAGDVMEMTYISRYPEGGSYTFKDSEPIDYAPQFVWYVFDKVTFKGVVPSDDEITAEAVNTDMPITSEFSTSNQLINDIQNMWLLTEQDNIHSGVESDCPHRERLPYTGDGQSVSATVMSNFDGRAFYTSWFRTMREAQDKETGYVPNSAPWCVAAGGGVAWGAAMTLMPWNYYLAYGDRRMLEDNYEAARRQAEQMTRWVDDRGIMLQKQTNASDGKEQTWFNLGDWVPTFQLPDASKVHTYVYWRCFDRMAHMAEALGKKDDAQRFRSIADKTAEAYNTAFYTDDKTGFGECGPNFMAVEMGLLSKRPQLKDILYNEIAVKHNNHLDVGFIGLEVFFSSLAKAGLNDVAYACINQTDYPSYGEMLKKGYTTMWEQFDGVNSENHPFLGNGLTWLYRTLAGVNADASAPAFRHFTVAPDPATGLSDVNYSNNTPYGLVGSHVRYADGRVSIEVTVPVGSRATVLVPAAGYSTLTINDQPADKAKAVTSTARTAKGFTVEVPQGHYVITATR